MRKLLTRLGAPVTVAMALLASADSYAGDAAAGKAKAAACMGCHGSAGKSTIPTYPHLAGQNKMYLVSALKAYRAKQRSGGMAVVMQGQVATLSDTDIENLAEYYSAL